MMSGEWEEQPKMNLSSVIGQVGDMVASSLTTSHPVLVLTLTIVAWELVKRGVKNLCKVTYYKNQGDGAVLRVKLLFWDTEGREEFEGEGYTRHMPPENES